MQGSFLGPEYTQKEIEEQLKIIGANYETLDEDELIETVANDFIK